MAPLLEQADSLGIEAPLEQGFLRQVDGRCVFLSPEFRCRIHARWGAEAKPRVCQQYPLVGLQTEDGTRPGVDPGCYHTWRSWREGPVLDLDQVLLVNQKERPESEVQGEVMLIRLLDTVSTPAQALSQLAATGIEQRWARLLRGLDPEIILARAPGPKARAALRPILEAPDPAPPFPDLDPDLAAFTLHTTRTFIALRQGDPQLRVIGNTLLMLLGSLAAAWANPSAAAYGEALAGWTRGLRWPLFWSAIVHDPEVLRGLVTGQHDPGVS